jgi:hypothetical protein
MIIGGMTHVVIKVFSVGGAGTIYFFKERGQFRLFFFTYFDQLIENKPHLG